MREFVFTLSYDDGDALMDVLADSPDVRVTTLVCPMTTESFWRIDRVTGSQDDVDQVTEILESDEYDASSISDRRCGGSKYTDILDDAAGRSTVFTHVSDATRCDAISLIADRYLPGPILCEVKRRENRAYWRLLMRTDEKVGMLYDTIGGRLRDGIEFRFEHLESVATPPTDPLASMSLRPEQRRVLETAAEMGYYETPRETTLDDVADRLACPRSTVSYRLRRAEARLVETFLSST
jgi:predicted DNA binding protein